MSHPITHLDAYYQYTVARWRARDDAAFRKAVSFVVGSLLAMKPKAATQHGLVPLKLLEKRTSQVFTQWTVRSVLYFLHARGYLAIGHVRGRANDVPAVRWSWNCDFQDQDGSGVEVSEVDAAVSGIFGRDAQDHRARSAG